MREIYVKFKLDDEQEKELTKATQMFNDLAKSRGKQGYDEEDMFTLMMVYASKDGIDERLNLWEMLIKYKSENITNIIDNFSLDLEKE